MHTASLVIMGYDDSSASSSATAVDEEEGRNARPRRTDEEAIPLSAVESGQTAQESKPGQNVRRRRLSLSEARKQRKAEAEHNKGREEVPVAVVEQRVSNLAQGCLCKSFKTLWHARTKLMPGLVLMTKPFEHVLGLIPKGVLAGLFVSRTADVI